MILKAEKISKSYHTGDGPLKVLKNIDLYIDRGEMVSVMGPSGCGKSTLLNILGTLDEPDSGQLWINNEDVTSLSDENLSFLRNNTIGFIFQFHHLLPEFTVIENLIIPQMIKGTSHEEATIRGLDLLSKVGLSDRKRHKPSQISGGERQRVAVLRALVNHPQIIFADEPTGNLDISSGEVVLDLMTELNKEYGVTYLIVTHNPEVAKRCDRHYDLTNGRLEIYEQK